MSLLALVFAAHAATPGAGDLVFTEVHPRASPSNCEWFEVANASGAAQDLEGCFLAWDSTTSRVGELAGILPASATASAPAVFGRDTDSCKDDNSAPIDCVAWDSPERTTCVAPVDVAVAGISITDSADGTLCIACGSPTDPSRPCDPADPALTLVDAVSFNWEQDFDADCPLDSTEGRCSAQHDLDPSSADANDDLDSWCIAEPGRGGERWSYGETPTDSKRILGSPGEENACPQPAETCAAGDLRITEIMSRPQSTTDSWLEITVADSVSECSLEGCVIADVGPETDRSVVLGANARFRGGDIAVFAQGGGPSLDLDGEIPAIGVSGLYIGNAGDVTELSITCDGEVVDAVPVSEAFVDARCAERGCSAQLRDDAGPVDPSDPDPSFCVAPVSDATTFVSAKSTDENTYTLRGTPGAPTVCASYDWPEAGEVYITEILADGVGATPDWFEVHNASDRTLDLQWCSIVQADAAEDDWDGTDGFVPRYASFLADDLHQYAVEPGEYAVFAKGSCLDGSDEDITTDTGIETSDEDRTECDDGAYLFGSVYLKADLASQLQLVCEGVVVDEVTYNFDAQQVLEGHTLSLSPDRVGVDGAVANDDWDQWCAAPFTGQTFETASGDVNYGTPGAANQCEAPPELKGSGLGCLCAATPGPLPLSGAVVLAGLAGLVWRRRED